MSIRNYNMGEVESNLTMNFIEKLFIINNPVQNPPGGLAVSSENSDDNSQ